MINVSRAIDKLFQVGKEMEKKWLFDIDELEVWNDWKPTVQV